MINPCETCVRQSACIGLEPCRRRDMYKHWKEKAREIAEKHKRRKETG